MELGLVSSKLMFMPCMSLQSSVREQHLDGLLLVFCLGGLAVPPGLLMRTGKSSGVLDFELELYNRYVNKPHMTSNGNASQKGYT